MRKRITVAWLRKIGACEGAINAFAAQAERDPLAILHILIREDKLDWANWLVVRLMTYRQYVKYAVYAAKQVIRIYEKRYPDDKRPRQAIVAARKCIEKPSKKNKSTAAYAAPAAAYAAYAAPAAAYAAAYAAAHAAAHYASDAAAYATGSQERRCHYAKEYASKIVKYGIRILKRERKR